LKQCLTVLRSQVKHRDAATQNAIFEGEKALFSRLGRKKEPKVSKDIIVEFLNTLDTEEMGLETTRIKAAEAAESLATVAKGIDGTAARFLEVLEKWLRADRSYAVQQTLLRIQRDLRG
jgi:hypothetical protein